MSKLGDAYQEVVTAVQRALEPGAEVTAGEWVEGPDGERDMDVAVRSVVEGRETLVLIECKDHRRPVGIGFVDAFDSKRRDLGADRAIMYSNSGFTEQAEGKARRVGIDLASAMAEGDLRVRIRVYRDFIARRLSVEKWLPILYWRSERSYGLPEAWNPGDLTYQRQPVVNWIRAQSLRLLREHEGKSVIVANYAFLAEHEFVLAGERLLLHGIGFRLDCVREWLGQTVAENVTLGSYDVLRRRVIVPSGQEWSVGPVDPDAWVRREGPPPSAELEPGGFDFGLTLLNPVAGDDHFPNLDSIIREREERVVE